MADPATGSVAATATAITSAGGMALLSTFNTIPLAEYLPGTIFACIGAVGWQFIAAQVAREKAAQSGKPPNERPVIDLVTVGYSLFGAPLASGALIAIIHMFGGTANFLSLGGFMLAGAAAPTLVSRAVGLFVSVIPNKPPSGGA
jgi:hypothetical protein